jgi:membrane fusion protein (multidrug efflux system)
VETKEKETVETKETTGGRRIRVIAGAAVVVLVLGVIAWWHYRGQESTDDAQIDGHITQIAARVSGTIVKVSVDNNDAVGAGTLLVQIDPRDYQVAVDRAEAELADARATAAAAQSGVPITQVSAQAGVHTASGGVEQADAAVVGAERGVEAARANLVAAQARQREREANATKEARDVDRLKPLVEKNEISRQQFDAAVAEADAARAAADAATSEVAAAQAAISVAEQRARQARAEAGQARAALANARTAPEQVRVTRAKAQSAAARVKQAEAALAQARLNLQYTTVKAPTAGVVSRKTVEVGQVVQAGQPLMAIVDLSDVWVTANFKETQLKSMRPGQHAVVEVDALGGREFEGHVDSIAAATGAKFSLLPPENATGNYVKVVQRVPVKIVLDAGQDPNHQLRPGMSVEPTVYVR